MRYIVAAAVALFISAKPGLGQEIVLKVSDQFPPAHSASVTGPQAFMRRVEELVPGKVKFQHFPAQQLAKANAQIDAVRTGIADIAIQCSCYITEKLPLSTVAEIPGTFRDTKKAADAYYRLAQGILAEKEYAKYGLHPLFTFLVTPYQILMRRQEPITTIEEFGRLKLRVAGAGGDHIAAALGAVGAQIPSSDLYLALERGTVDGILFSVPAIWPYKLDEVLNSTTTNASFGSVGYTAFMRDETWNSLPEDVQEAFSQASHETSLGFAKAWIESDQDTIKKFASMGKNAYELGEELQAEIDTRMKKLADDWVEQMEGRGLPGREVYETFLSMIKSNDN